MRYRRPTMNATRDQRTSRAFLALTVLLTLVWPASVVASAFADGPAVHIAAMSGGGKRAMVRQQRPLGGLVANWRDKRARYGPTPLGMQTGALEIKLLVAAGSGSPAARPRRRSQSAAVDARAPPSLQPA
jgi:hypothetical protein